MVATTIADAQTTEITEAAAAGSGLSCSFPAVAAIIPAATVAVAAASSEATAMAEDASGLFGFCLSPASAETVTASSAAKLLTTGSLGGLFHL